MIKYLFSTIFILSFSGCFYPIYKTIQPKSKIVVTDIDGAPIENAKVYLVSNAMPYERLKSIELKETNSMGIAKFDKIREWRIEALWIHGADVYYWNLCIKKDGYKTVSTRIKMSKKHIILKDGNSTECPDKYYL